MSKIVKLLGRDDDGNWALEGTIRFDNGQWSADTIGAKRTLEDTYHWNNRDYSKKDGEEFLEILPKVVNGSYGIAVLEDEPEAPQQHARERGEIAFAEQERQRARRKSSYSSIPGILLDIARNRNTPTTTPEGQNSGAK